MRNFKPETLKKLIFLIIIFIYCFNVNGQWIVKNKDIDTLIISNFDTLVCGMEFKCNLPLEDTLYKIEYYKVQNDNDLLSYKKINRINGEITYGYYRKYLEDVSNEMFKCDVIFYCWCPALIWFHFDKSNNLIDQTFYNNDYSRVIPQIYKLKIEK